LPASHQWRLKRNQQAEACTLDTCSFSVHCWLDRG
jgi:hypothetical protein